MEEVKGKKGKEGTKKEKWNVLECPGREKGERKEKKRKRKKIIRRVRVWRRKKEGKKRRKKRRKYGLKKKRE